MASVEQPCYSFAPVEGTPWTTAQEKSVALDYPFDLHQESPEHFVTLTYLQFLWLPQSIMPLQLLVPSLRRISALPSSSQSAHSLHSLLDPLLQTTRAISNKYNVELVQILQDGGGAGELEETMMWYALHHEKTGVDRKPFNGLESGGQEPWVDERWRQEWLERLERREVQIQILLYMTKLSLPGPAPIVSRSKKRKRSLKETDPLPSTPDERLESFMDKLSILQLTSHLETHGPKLNHDEKDWAQLFCECVVETMFKPQLPVLCSLLRSKVFPDSPFSDTDTATASRSPSPELTEADSGGPSAAPATSLIAPKTNTQLLSRTRSRSLSVSLAQEREERERSVSMGPGKKRLLNREVSMSRAFKPKPKAESKGIRTALEPQVNLDGETQAENSEVILVEDTPRKPRVISQKASQLQSDVDSSSINFFGVRQSAQSLFGSSIDETDDDDAWMLDTSPDVLLLQPGHRACSNLDDEYEVITHHTPSKKPRRHGRGA